MVELINVKRSADCSRRLKRHLCARLKPRIADRFLLTVSREKPDPFGYRKGMLNTAIAPTF
jgi:hypothetical protein